jgi:hypothetical protein
MAVDQMIGGHPGLNLVVPRLTARISFNGSKA